MRPALPGIGAGGAIRALRWITVSRRRVRRHWLVSVRESPLLVGRGGVGTRSGLIEEATIGGHRLAPATEAAAVAREAVRIVTLLRRIDAAVPAGRRPGRQRDRHLQAPLR